MLLSQYTMFKNNILKLDKQTNSIVKIMFFYNFSSIVLNTFFGVIIFQLNNSLLELLIYSLIMIFVSDFSFFIFGVFSSYFKLNMKNYLFSIITNTLSYIWLIFFHNNILDFYIFGILHGVSIGTYWLSLHTYELSHTKNENRDFYVSAISVGTQILNLTVPFLSTIIFYFSLKLFNNEYLLLFYIIPLIYMFSLLPLKNIKEFHPNNIYFKELIKNLLSKEAKIISLYTFFDSFKFGNLIVLNSYITISALKSLLNIGIAVTIFSLITIFLTAVISNYINENNRLITMFIGVVGIIFAYLPLYFEVNIYTFAWWSLLLIIFNPFYEITSRVINLYSMEKLIVNNSFYTGMLYRTVILWFGRVFSLGLFIILYLMILDDKIVISLMISMFLISYIFEYIMAKKILKL